MNTQAIDRSRLCARACILLLSSLLLSACGDDGIRIDSGAGDDEVSNECGTVVDIAATELVTGRLEDGDCRYNELDVGDGDDSPVDEYRIVLAAPAVLTVTMRSTEFNAFLFLVERSESCKAACPGLISLAEVVDDNSAPGGSGQDAQFVFNVPAAGTYLILANLIGSPREGEYTVETSTM